MVVFPPVRYRKRHGRPRQRTRVALTLVAAEYEEGTAVLLTFDRAVNIDAAVGGQLVLDDGQFSGMMYEGIAYALVGATTVRVELQSFGPSAGAGVTVSVGAGTGIVAAGDGQTWAGVTNLALPFPTP